MGVSRNGNTPKWMVYNEKNAFPHFRKCPHELGVIGMPMGILVFVCITLAIPL
jgi:hypothetical protein